MNRTSHGECEWQGFLMVGRVVDWSECVVGDLENHFQKAVAGAVQQQTSEIDREKGLCCLAAPETRIAGSKVAASSQFPRVLRSTQSEG